MKSGKNNKKVLQKLNHWSWRRNSRADVIWWSNHQIKHHHVFNILHFIVCVCEVKPFFPFTLSNHYYAMRDVTKNSLCCLHIYIYFFLFLSQFEKSHFVSSVFQLSFWYLWYQSDIYFPFLWSLSQQCLSITQTFVYSHHQGVWCHRGLLAGCYFRWNHEFLSWLSFWLMGCWTSLTCD